MNKIENEQLSSSASECVRDGVGSLSQFPGLLKKIIRNRVWESRQLKTGRIVELASLAELITSKPLEGWGEDPKKIEALIKDDPEALVMYREAMKQQGNNQHTSKVDNITVAPKAKGTSKAYTLSRLQRESPKLFKAVCDGEMSANAAAIEAGFRKKPTPREICLREFLKVDDKDSLMRELNDIYEEMK